MKFNFVPIIIMLSKWAAYGFCIQLLFFNMIIAGSAVGQKSASVKEVEITLDLRNSTISKLFKEIETKTDFRFSLDRSELKTELNNRISITDQNIKVADVLMEVSKYSGIKFKQVNNNINVRKIEKGEAEPLSFEVIQVVEDIDITGKITDENGEGLPGASVVVKGTSNGTTTNIDGDFKLTASDEAILTISFVGYVTQEVPVGGRSTIDSQMELDAEQLEEVVIVGYGAKDKRTLAGAVQTVDPAVFEARAITNAASALQGAAPGLVVNQNTAQPGAEGFTIRVRGASTAAGLGLGNNASNPTLGITGGTVGPLVLVDGIQSSFTTLNPNDIESISILKDGAAAIYGNQAANGVILVTTKKGIKGKLKVTYDVSFASNAPTQKPVKLSIREFMETTNEARANDGELEFWPQEFFDAIGTNQVLNFAESNLGGGVRADSWLTFNNPENELADLVFENGVRQNHNLGISGGGDNSTFYLSLGYLNENGVINTKFDTYRRYNLRLNNTFNLTDRIKLTSQNALELGDRSLNTQTGQALTQIERNIPFFPLNRPDGEFYRFRGFENPLALLEGGSEQEVVTTRIISNFQVDYDILDGLKLTANAGVNNRDIRFRLPQATIPQFNTYSPELGGSGNGGYANGGTDPGPTAFRNNPASLTERFTRETYINYSGYLTYEKTFANLHNIGVTTGFSHEQRRDNEMESFIRSFPTNDLFALGLGDQQNARVDQEIDTWTIRGLFGRINYNFDDKYIVEANIRRDESSRFDPDNRAGVFAGYLFAWRASEESFIKDLGIFDNLKLRMSYGETGNQNGIRLYDYLSLINNNINTRALFGPAVGNANPAENPDCTTCGEQTENPSYTEANVVSLDRTWETVATTNFGLDVGMLDSKLNFSFDYFIKKNENMLVPITLPEVLGANAPTLNIGELETKGWEFQVDWKDNIGEVNYYINATVFDNQNKLVNLNGGSNRRLGVNNYVEGYALGTYFGYQWDGIIQTQEELDTYIERFPNGGIPNPTATFGALAIGDAKYADLDGNGQLSALGNPADGDTGDLVELGNATPRYNFGFTLGGNYKGFDVRMFWQGVAKRTIFKSGIFSSPIATGSWYYPGLKYWVDKPWTPENTGSNFPGRSIRKNDYNYQVSENTKLNGAYVRLKNIQVGYSLPSAILDKLGLSRCRIYVSGENLWEIDGIDSGLNWDPESGQASLSYPFVRTYAVGAQITF